MTDAPTGHLTDNTVAFCRFLRAAGLPVGPAQSIAAAEALKLVGIRRRDDVFSALFGVLVTRADQRALFADAFELFWRGDTTRVPDRDGEPAGPAVAPRPAPGMRRLAEALGIEHNRRAPEQRVVEIDVRRVASSEEILRRKDFEQMTAAELVDVKRAMARFHLPITPFRTRRFQAAPNGARVDPHATMRRSLQSGGATIPLAWRAPRLRKPAIVALCDISGSMATYSRVILQFLHAVTQDHDRVHSFVFGTRLTNITRHLARRDIDDALARISETVVDWGGGTRIGHVIWAFNRQWSRRVLAQGAVVLLITDGLDRDAGAGLGQAMERLRRSCRRLIWLNPLLRFSGFEPKSMGIKAMLPHVDEMRPVHNLDSLRSLVAALQTPHTRRRDEARNAELATAG